MIELMSKLKPCPNRRGRILTYISPDGKNDTKVEFCCGFDTVTVQECEECKVPKDNPNL